MAWEAGGYLGGICDGGRRCDFIGAWDAADQRGIQLYVRTSDDACGTDHHYRGCVGIVYRICRFWY